MRNERRLADGRVELVDTRRVEASPLYNHDLAPVPLSRRNWTTYNFAALWVSMAHCIPTYMLASGLMSAGMNWSQALVTILLGNTIVLIPILLNSHPGTKYGIPFPVFARAAYGTLGSNVPALMRALVACGWFGIQAWIGGEALQTMFKTLIPGWATLSLNMPDFTRFGRSQREQIVGQVVALPTTMSVFAAMGVMITSATVIIYGESIWDPVQLVGRFTSPVVVAISMFTAVVATLAVNIAANVVSPANDFANAFPEYVSFKTGGLITGILGILIQPWRLLADASGYIFTWLLGYSGGLGSIAGVLIVDYWIIRTRELQLEDLYLPDGVYRGWNWRAIAATAFGCGLAWGGLVVPALKPLYNYAWFVGFFAAGLAHFALAPRTTTTTMKAEPAELADN